MFCRNYGGPSLNAETSCSSAEFTWQLVLSFVNNLGEVTKQWFPTFLILRPRSKMLHRRLAPAMTCNSKGVQITTDKIKTLSFHMVDSQCLHPCEKETAHAIQWGD